MLTPTLFDAQATGGPQVPASLIPAEVSQRFNALTHFPRDLNAEYRAKAENVRAGIERRLAKFDQKTWPDDVAEAFDRYLVSLKHHASEEARSRQVAPPWTVTGRSNYRGNPERAARIEDKAREKVESAMRRLLKAVRAYDPRRPVQVGEEDATARLTARIAELEGQRDRMKTINAAFRKHRKTKDYTEAARAAMIDTGTAPEKAATMFSDGDPRDGYPNALFPPYMLTNIGANIRRLQDQLKTAERMATSDERRAEGEGVLIEEDAAANRVRIYFDQIPDEDMRRKLKGQGWRWSRTEGAWQRQRTDNAWYSALNLTGLRAVGQ